MRCRKGSTLANGLILIVFLLVFFTVLQHISPFTFGSGGSSSSTTSGTTRGSCSSEQVIGAAAQGPPGMAAPNALTLSSYIIQLPVQTSTKADAQLLNDTWWGEVFASSGQTFKDMPQGLYWGFLNDSQSMQDWINQSVTDPPKWNSAGPMNAVQQQLLGIKSNATASGNSTLAHDSVRNFVLGLSGDGLAALDQFTGGSLTALKTYQETHDPYLALCQTFPGQMAQLYANSFDPGIPPDQRAHFFGELLMVGSLTMVLAGHDHFDAKFRTALRNANLLDVWPQTKALLVDVTTKVSSNAAGLTLQAMSKVAARFPSSPWAAGYTGFRIESMVDVLHDAGQPKDLIEQKLTDLAQAADGAGDPAAVGDAADRASYDDGHAIKLYVGSQKTAYLYSDAKATAMPMKASFLDGRVPGFQTGNPAFLKVVYHEAKATYYHYYTGGDFWFPTVPDSIAVKGDIVTISVEILTRDAFVNSIPSMDFVNDQGVPYVGTITRMTDHSLVGNEFTMRFTEDPPIEMNLQFAVTGELAESIGWSAKSGPFLDMHLTPDVFNDGPTMRLYYDGYNPPSLGLVHGVNSQPVYDVSTDGVRLRVVYSSGELHSTTLYPVYNPSVLYRLGKMAHFDLTYDVTGYSQSFIIDNVAMTRILEHEMAYAGGTTAVARIGAEVAYTVSTEKLGLKDVVMNEPMEGGADLYTPGHKVAIEARMLQRTIGESGDTRNSDIARELNKLVGRLNSDFQYWDGQGSRPTAGYAVLTYILDQNTIQTIVLEVLPQ